MTDRMKKYWDKHDQWIKERDEVLLSLDLKKYKAFYRKWQKEGVYTMPLPDNDMVVEISMRQSLLALPNLPEGKMIEAQLWLIDHGCDPHPWKKGNR
jgi:hypothetical protein